MSTYYIRADVHGNRRDAAIEKNSEIVKYCSGFLENRLNCPSKKTDIFA